DRPKLKTGRDGAGDRCAIAVSESHDFRTLPDRFLARRWWNAKMKRLIRPDRNWLLLRFYRQGGRGLTVTQDKCFIEGENDTHVRRILVWHLLDVGGERPVLRQRR